MCCASKMAIALCLIILPATTPNNDDDDEIKDGTHTNSRQ
jgi:hypothetical protein